ncbi:MAG TPA: SgcJ/EcaC family oxidoreductase [Ktedonobacteraceae bacterium]
MNNYPFQQQGSPSSNEIEVRRLYQQLLDSWNRRNADAFASSFTEDSHVIGFDGSQMAGQAEIASTLQQIFADHPTGSYVSKVRDVRLLSPDVALLRAVVGMVPHGRSDIEPALNAHQTLIATMYDGQWRIALFQNTPAQFHGRPDLVQLLTDELRQLLA